MNKAEKVNELGKNINQMKKYLHELQLLKQKMNKGYQQKIDELSANIQEYRRIYIKLLKELENEDH